MNIMKNVYLLSFLCASCITATATPLLYQSFSGTAGSSLSSVSGVTLSGSGSAPTLASGNLNYTGIADPVGNTAFLPNNSQTASINYTSQTSPSDTLGFNNTYMSFMLKLPSVSGLGATGSRFIWLSQNSTSVASIWIKSNGSGFSLGVSRDLSTVQWNNSEIFSANNTMFMVVDYSWEAPFGRPGAIHAWLMPPQDQLLTDYRGADNGPGNNAAFFVTDSNNSLFPNTVSFASASGTGINLDELRVGTKWSEVTPVPEPSTTALAAFGIMGLAVGYHRRKKSF